MAVADNSSAVKLYVGAMSQTIAKYIVKTQLMKMSAELFNSFMLWGPPGIGKSQSLKTIKKLVEEATGKKVVITDVRLLLFNPVDLRGIPVPDANREYAKWLKPQIFQMDDSDDVINILMMDEISAAAPSVQAASYQITLDRKVGEHKLPDNCYIICAGNRVQDKSVAYKMPKALANRLTHFEIKSDLDDWKQWAIGHGIDSKIIGYLNFKPSNLYHFDATSDDNAFPTPRTWEMADTYLRVFGDLNEAYNCIAGCIGIGVAGEFKRYCQVYTQIPSVDDIMAGKKVDYATAADINYALASAICSRAAKASDEQLSNIVTYIYGMQKEFSILTMKDMLLIPDLKSKILKLPASMQWVSKYQKYIK